MYTQYTRGKISNRKREQLKDMNIILFELSLKFLKRISHLKEFMKFCCISSSKQDISLQFSVKGWFSEEKLTSHRIKL